MINSSLTEGLEIIYDWTLLESVTKSILQVWPGQEGSTALGGTNKNTVHTHFNDAHKNQVQRQQTFILCSKQFTLAQTAFSQSQCTITLCSHLASGPPQGPGDSGRTSWWRYPGLGCGPPGHHTYRSEQSPSPLNRKATVWMFMYHHVYIMYICLRGKRVTLKGVNFYMLLSWLLSLPKQ